MSNILDNSILSAPGRLRTEVKGFGRRLTLSAGTVALVWAIADVQSADAQSVTGSGDLTSGISTPNWTVGGDLTVGDIGTGTLTIANGGTVSNDNAFVGNQAGGNGTVTVSGIDGLGNASTWTNNGDLVLGQSGTGILNVTGGGTVSNQNGYVGATGAGTATVSGTDGNGHASTWTSAAQLFVGDAGTGTLSILVGGVVNSAGGVIGNQLGSSGTVTISGSDGSGHISTWTSTAPLSIGLDGTGALNILGGGVVNSDQGLIGGTTGSTSNGIGTVTVSGTDGQGHVSTWSAANNIYVGFQGAGTLAIADGGRVSTRAAGGGAAAVYIGYSGGSTGTVTISSSTADVSSLSATDRIAIGVGGTGTLTIDKGGLVHAGSDTYVTDTGGSSGTLNLLGDSDGHGVLETGSVIDGSGAGVLNLNGGTLRATRETNNFLNGFAVLTVGSGGAWFDTNGHAITVSTEFFGSSSVNKLGLGTLTMTGDSSAFTGTTTISSGTLQLGDGGTSGAIGGTVFDNGILAFNRSDNSLVLAGSISGSGAVNQVGPGTTTLTGVNTHTGGTIITAGTLQLGNGGKSGSIQGDVTDNGVLVFNRSDSVSFGGVISGSGAVRQTGTGTTILTGANTYTGGTTITVGTLQVGNGGTSGSILGNVTDNGALAFDRSDNVSFGNIIAGGGTVNQIGSGSTTLTGVNVYSGGTEISGGTLVGSATSFGGGAITDNAVLVINQPANADFANAINGTGSFVKQGAGRLNYIGTGALSGPVTVAAGLFSVNGSLPNSAVTVQNGATLGGNGAVGATTIQSGGAIAPGNSIGTLHINGTYSQTAGSIYQVQLDPNTSTSDLITVNGAATLASGAGLSVSKAAPGDYRIGTIYRILTATNGVTGTYALSGDASLSPYLGLKDTYDANNAYLTVMRTAAPGDTAQTFNQTQTATGTDSLPDNSNVASAVLNTPDPTNTRSAFDQLSGEALASAKSALITGSLLVRDTTFDHVRDMYCTDPSDLPRRSDDRPRTTCPPHSDRPTLWAQGFKSWGNIASDGNAASLSQSTGGFLVGVDVPVYDWRVGYFGGFSRTDFSVKARNSSGNSNNYHLGLYGGTQWGDLAVQLGASYSWNDVAADRSVTVGTLHNDLRADYDAGTTQVFGELGQPFGFERVTLEPFASVAYVNLRTGEFSETGGDTALTARAGTTQDTFTTLGVRPSSEISWDGVNTFLRGMAGWRHTFGDVVPTSTVSFAGSAPFTISGVPIARDAAVIEAGLDFVVQGDVTAGLTYGGQFGGRETDHSIRGTIAITF